MTDIHDPTRGILVALALGVAFWIVVGLLIWLVA